MNRARGATQEEALTALAVAIDHHCNIAFAHNCRLAARAMSSGHDAEGFSYFYEFMIISPGEFPDPKGGWTLYEDRAGIAVGRSV